MSSNQMKRMRGLVAALLLAPLMAPAAGIALADDATPPTDAAPATPAAPAAAPAASPAAAPAPVAAAEEQTVTVRGEGATVDQAIRTALRRAVEQVVGVQISTVTAVDKFEVVRNEIVSHAEGYVRRYRVVSQGGTDDGGKFAEIEAAVDAGQVRDSVDAFPALMAMADHPRIAVLGLTADFDSAGAVLPEAVELRGAVADILRERFKFAVTDTATMPHKGSAQTRREAMALAHAANVDYAVVVTVAGRGRGEISMDAIKLADGTVVARESEIGLAAGHRDLPYASIADKVFPLTVAMAHEIASDIQAASLSSAGYRYSVILDDFPPEARAAVRDGLRELPGFVRMSPDAVDAHIAQYSVWSQQTGDEFGDAVAGLIGKQHLDARARVHGTVFRFDYVDEYFR